MYSAGYHSSLRILKSRTWHVCKNGDFERDTEDFKKTLGAHKRVHFDLSFSFFLTPSKFVFHNFIRSKNKTHLVLMKTRRYLMLTGLSDNS